MTDKEIIKALECCIMPTSDCLNCPLYIKGDGDCVDKAKSGALNIINRQQAENERLKAENSNLISGLTSLQNDLTSAKAEVERLSNLVLKEMVGEQRKEDEGK